jgi:SAM-dependent methyltransferase
MMDEPMEAVEAASTSFWDERQCIYTPCLLCGGSDFVVIAVPSDIAAQHCYLEQFHQRRLVDNLSAETRRASLTDRVSFMHNYETNILACRGCGLLCRNPHPPAEAVTEAYAGDRYEQPYLEAEFESQLTWARAKIPLVARHVAAHRSLHMVEVGSFVGGFLEAAREHGWDIIGIDPGEAVVRFCRDRGLPVLQGTLEEASQPSNGLDAVVIWNTFDQLPDPRPLLMTIAQLLKPDGLLVIRIPHGNCYRSALEFTKIRRWTRKPIYTGLAWNNLLSFPYLYGYGLTTLDSLVGEFGLVRVAVYPDTLMTTAVPEMKWWVTIEERLVKRLWRLATTLALSIGDSSLGSAAWLDVYYRKPAQSRSTSLGVSPVATPCVLNHTIAKKERRNKSDA